MLIPTHPRTGAVWKANLTPRSVLRPSHINPLLLHRHATPSSLRARCLHSCCYPACTRSPSGTPPCVRPRPLLPALNLRPGSPGRPPLLPFCRCSGEHARAGVWWCLPKIIQPNTGTKTRSGTTAPIATGVPARKMRVSLFVPLSLSPYSPVFPASTSPCHFPLPTQLYPCPFDSLRTGSPHIRASADLPDVHCFRFAPRPSSPLGCTHVKHAIHHSCKLPHTTSCILGRKMKRAKRTCVGSHACRVAPGMGCHGGQWLGSCQAGGPA